MVDAKLYTAPVTYPKLEAVSNAKLGVTKQDVFRLAVDVSWIQLVARRASTSDPWQLEVEYLTGTSILKFAKAGVDISSDQLNWKAMADLVLKAHQRPSSDQVWQYVGYEGRGVPFVVADASSPTLYKGASLAQIQAVLQATVQETGDIAVQYTDDGTTSMGTVSISIQVLSNGIANILSKTTSTSEYVVTPLLITDLRETNGQEGSSIGADYTFTDIKGTDGLSVGNYSGGDLRLELTIPGYNGILPVNSIRRLTKGSVHDIPSIQLDKCRKAASANQPVVLKVQWMSDTDSFSVKTNFGISTSVGVAATIANASVANPDGVYEIDMDQANSLDVLATAAFAGVGGLVSVGTQASLEQILSESFLSTTFGQIAVTLGTTTAALISGYVSALIAAYVNNWITSDQLFDLQNHVAWLKQGAANITMAAGAGVAIGSIPTLLSYLGVSNNVLSMAMNAVGGAATSAGVALGMASVMSKVVRHTYWGE